MRAEELKISRRAAEGWHGERPGDATHEGAASVAVKTTKLKGSWGEADTWFPKREKEFIHEGAVSRGLSTLEMPGPWGAHQVWQKVWRRTGLTLEGKLWVLQAADSAR